MHRWGEEGFDWQGLDDAIWYIEKWFSVARISVSQTKEKFGCARIYCRFGWVSLHSIIYPRHVYNKFPKWLDALDMRFISKIIRPLNYIVVPFHRFVYRAVYKGAVKKYPHLREEIVCDADYRELLVGI